MVFSIECAKVGEAGRLLQGAFPSRETQTRRLQQRGNTVCPASAKLLADLPPRTDLFYATYAFPGMWSARKLLHAGGFLLLLDMRLYKSTPSVPSGEIQQRFTWMDNGTVHGVVLRPAVMRTAEVELSVVGKRNGVVGC